MIAVSEFFPRMLPYLPGCSEPLAAQALVDSAIAFCEDSLVLREDLDPIVLVPGLAQYELDAPSQQQIARVMRVAIDRSEISLVMGEDASYRGASAARPTRAYTTRNGSEFLLNLFPAPDRAYEMRVNAVLRPLRTATQLEDDLFHLWCEPVILGALSRCMMTPAQPFTDLAAGSMYAVSAVAASRRARIEGSYGRVRSDTRAKQRPFA